MSRKHMSFYVFFLAGRELFTVATAVLNLHFLGGKKKEEEKSITSFIFQMQRKQSQLSMLVYTSRPFTPFSVTQSLLAGFTYIFLFFDLNKYFESMNHLSRWFSVEQEGGGNPSSCWEGIWEKCVSAAMIGNTLVDIAGGLEIKQQRNSFTVRAQEILTR